MIYGFPFDKKDGPMKKVDEKKIEWYLEQLTLEEKIRMVHGNGLFRTGGVKRLGIPELYTSDGPCGVRCDFKDDEWLPIGTSHDYVTYLPCNSAITSTWNVELAKKSGDVLGSEVRGRGKDVSLAPGINIKRSPMCGRNFEYMSEDPYLTGKMAVSVIKGIQENDVASCVKHFAANNQETDRLYVDTIIDERALFEIYLPAFEEAVSEGESYSIMNAYNKVNGSWCGESEYLLDTVLRKEWGYDGCVISDWGSIHSTENTAKVSMDLEMSVTYNFDDYFLANPYKKAIEEGKIEEKTLDDKVRNILRLMLRLKMIGEEKENRKSGEYNTVAHQQATYEVAKESMILLKNEDSLLPLQKTYKKVAVIGQNASIMHANGGGSAEIKALYEISPLMGIHRKLGGNCEVKYAPGYYMPKKQLDDAHSWQEASLDGVSVKRENELDTQDEIVRKYREEALALAKECDKVIFVGGLNHEIDLEGSDRIDCNLPYHQYELIDALLEVRKDLVIVMVAGSYVDMTPFESKAKAILWSYYAGMESGNALADILFGDVNPSGKLAESFPLHMEDVYPVKLGEFSKEGKVEYKDSIYVGYRYYDTFGVDVLYPFGYGLSYSTFAYKKPVVECMEDKIQIRIPVTNTSEREGKEIVELYISKPESKVERAKQELKGFAKLSLNPGETKEAEFCLTDRDLSYYDVDLHKYVKEAGDYVIRLGASSRDIRQEVVVSVK